ncbi:GGDEF domain-containing protein, diguanylate cyclase (c-di-GMP synthetase) or its enzymatically inactive variants [Nitrosomonas sp. PY1]|uniref:TackOD1 domain-containing metal-binding protein n=1 Tax=Nitrosomonas sp. PY1 TaxID=1803906 RepID=UPI001FC87725|nr:diguanylate cyclase [Nitrosomonas sp. PY1]GKS69905.1 GGDEF domain-containing protein, diguanylate cyclase (c-di-GMP synthetase) or its enzymatically inactive variants [Nitrosomonas sp. PY1]
MLILFSPNNIVLPDVYANLYRIQRHSNFSEWKLTKMAPLAFIIDGEDAQYVNTIINEIRRDDTVFASLCFVTESSIALDSQLLDGQLTEPSALQKKISDTEGLTKSFKNTEACITPQGRLIKYLWLRPDFIIQPQHEWKNARYYRYTLLEALNNDTGDSFGWLRKLAAARILEPVSLIDRQRECTHCRSAHLSFTDICPNCFEIDIALRPSLHCFTCGCVDAQDKFLHAGMLKCPKCNTHLRHIGSDYDRPLENYQCQSCNHTFSEGEIRVRCAVCEKSMKPDELVINEIQHWRLSDRGRVIAFRGEVFDLSSGFDQLDFISKELFIHDLDWMMVLSHRYKNINFSLFGIYFSNLTELVDEIGHARLLQVMESFAQRLRNLLRTPDLSTRTAENMLWLLLPNTDKQGLVGFHKRIEASMNQLVLESDQKLIYRFCSISSDQLSDQEDAELLLVRLSGELL